MFDIYIISFTPLNKIYVYFLVSPCDSLSCLNEGSCRVEAGVAACFCKGDYSGSFCEGKEKYKILYLPKDNLSRTFTDNNIRF